MNPMDKSLTFFMWAERAGLTIGTEAYEAAQLAWNAVVQDILDHKRKDWETHRSGDIGKDIFAHSVAMTAYVKSKLS